MPTVFGRNQADKLTLRCNTNEASPQTDEYPRRH
jgi:hypothetical protein